MRQSTKPVQAAGLYLRLLVARQAELLTELRSKRGEIDPIREPVMEQDQPMMAKESTILEKLSALESHELNRVNAALEKIRAGTYGVCEGCNASIPGPRLQAIPWAERCRDCEEATLEGEETAVEEKLLR